VPSNRRQRTWGQETRNRKVGKSALSRRDEYSLDFKKFYKDLLARDVMIKRTGLRHSESLGAIHDIMIDFLNLNMPDNVVRYSRLHEYLPEKDDKGDFKERWIYWRKLNEEPEIQDGREGAISTMYQKEFWQGLIVCVRGDGTLKGLYIPRGHLKSSIGTQTHTLWEICRQPDMRSLIRSLTGPLARMFMGDIKREFETNEKFREVYGDLGPPEKKEGAWNADAIQVKSRFGWKSRSKEYTLSSYGLESELVGWHGELIKLDDIVGESNTKTEGLRTDTRMRIERMFALLDPDCVMTDIGTRWEDDDAHGMFIDPAMSELASISSFFIATCLDGDKEVEASKRLTPLGYGAPIWPECFTHRILEFKRKGMKDDRLWYGQYFNQFHGTSLRTFSRNWIRHFEGDSEALARKERLDIYVFFDPASGKAEQAGKLDFTAGCVIGQTPDRRTYYFLDGFKERLPAALVIKAMVSLARKWHSIALENNSSFIAGVEESAYTNYLKQALDLELRAQSVDKHVSINGYSHKNEAKADRIRSMSTTYADYAWKWPKERVVTSFKPDGEPYDIVSALEEEFTLWPSIANEDLLDAKSGAFARTIPHDFLKTEERRQTDTRDNSTYSRGDAQAEEEACMALGGYEREREGEGRLALG